MEWLLLVLPLILKLIEWLLSLEESGRQLNARQSEKLAKILAANAQLKVVSRRMGVTE